VEGNGQYLPVFIESDFGLGRDQLWAWLWDQGIQTRRYFYPGAHLCEPYRSDMPWFKDMLPVTRKATEAVLCLPCYYDLTDRQIARICGAIAGARRDTAAVQRWYRGFLKSASPAPHMALLAKALRREQAP
jgi:dTDP-4-amino-4,6-dideoxygalactose transaminase